MPVLETAVNMPAAPAPRRIVVMKQDMVAVAESQFTGAQQLQEWIGASFWRAKVELPPMKRNTAAEWIGFLASLRGPYRRFMLGPSEAKTPQGSASGAPVVGPLCIKDDFVIPTKGWTADQVNVLRAGDWMEVISSAGSRLHLVTEAEDADSFGNAAFSVWPACREAYAEDSVIIVNSPRGMFRLNSIQHELYDANEAKIYLVSFDAVEAR